MSSDRNHRPIALVLWLAMAAPAGAAVFTVGPEPDCSHDDIQSAINALPATGIHEIRLRAAAVHSQQALQVTGRQVSIIGGYPDCAPSSGPTGAASILDGQGGAQAPVLGIAGTGNTVHLVNLVIRRGDAPASGHGGGIFFDGGGLLTLTRVTVVNNFAGFGGGINLSASGAPATLRLNADVLILNNTAQFDSGGIRLWGSADFPAELFMVAPNSAVMGNLARGIDPANGQPARGFGGGLVVVHNARAWIGSSGSGLNGAIYDNEARRGGGVAALGEGNGELPIALVTLFTTDPDRPGRIHANRARVAGGAVYLKPDTDSGITSRRQARFVAHDFRIEDNSAPVGSAIYSDFDDAVLDSPLGGWVVLNEPPPGAACADRRQALGPVAGLARACAPGLVCDAIEGNVAETDDAQPTTGAVIVLDKDSLFRSRCALHLRDNLGGNLFWMREASLQVRPCLIAGNASHERLIQAESGSNVTIGDCTIAGNTVNGAQVLAVDGSLTLHRSILHQPGRTSLAPGGGNRSIDWVLTSERQSLDGGNGLTVSLGDPRFWDPERDDYRLHAASDAVDFAPSIETGPDLDGKPHNLDLPFKPNRSGPRDLGAYERQVLLPVVRNGDFPLDLHQWTVLTPGTATWVEQGVDPGAVFISQIAPPGGQVTGLGQCVPLPGPGAWELYAHAMAPGTGLNRDFPVLIWRYRANSPNCTGTPTLEGELILPRSGSFVTTPTPAGFVAPEGQWTHNATVEVVLAVRDGDLVGTNAVRAHFDRVVLAPGAADAIFSDGFESP